MKLRPIGDYLVVKEVSEQDTSPSGIILPDTITKERPEKGEVVAVGPGKILENGSRAPMEITPGDVVVFKKYAPDEIKDKDTKYFLIRAEDVMAIIE